jgi:hypothetical protein
MGNKTVLKIIKKQIQTIVFVVIIEINPQFAFFSVERMHSYFGRFRV